jgi:hypothetical protein
MLTKDGICTLVDVIIVDPMQVDLFPWSCTTQGFDVSNAAQAKEKNYHNGHPTDQFYPLTIEVFGCLHKHVDVFLHDYVNTIWSLKGTESLSSFYLSHFSLLKSFDYITKDTSIFHLKSSSSRRLNYFLTSTPSWHTSHHHGQSIASHQFLIYKYDRPSTSSSYGHGKIFTTILNQLDVLSFLPFPLFYSFVHFPNLRCVS